MACLVSTNVYAAPQSSKPPIQGLDTTRLDGGKSLFQTKWSTVRLLMANHSDRGVVIMNRDNDHCITRSPSHFPPHISNDYDLGRCAEMLLSGFWVGPSVEDGWGFVEAIVYRTH